MEQIVKLHWSYPSPPSDRVASSSLLMMVDMFVGLVGRLIFAGEIFGFCPLKKKSIKILFIALLKGDDE